MYLDAPAETVNDPMPSELSVIAGALAGFALLFFVYPSPIIELSEQAVSALFTNLPDMIVTVEPGGSGNLTDAATGILAGN